MTGFYFTFLAVLLAGLGARDQVTVAGLTLRQGARPDVLAVGIVVSVATAAAAAWAASLIAPTLPPAARQFLAAVALALAGGEALLLSPRGKPKEPTHSLGAFGIVILSQQLTDAARFLVFAMAVATNAPLPAGVGGAVGGIVLIGAGWLAPEYVTRPLLRRLRRVIGGMMLLAGVILGLEAIYFP